MSIKVSATGVVASTDIAAHEGKRHDHLLRVIRSMSENGEIAPKNSAYLRNGNTYPMFLLSKEDAERVLTRIRKPKLDTNVVEGRRFGRWVVIDPAPVHVGRGISLRCVCDCGVERDVSRVKLLRGTSRSCGCLARDLSAVRETTHGGSYSSEYGIWCKIIARCENPNHPVYPKYGGRGIQICPEWRSSFEAFMRDMGPRPSPDHSVDRFPDKMGNYEPTNCRWATWEDQNNNKTDNHLLELDGRVQTLSQWAREMGMSNGALSMRIHAGWSVQDALTIPIGSITDKRNGGYKALRGARHD